MAARAAPFANRPLGYQVMPFTELLSPYTLALAFFLIAFIYSSVGLGGGSAYTALMALLGFSALAIPMVSLILNLLVTTIGSAMFIRKGHARLNLILPFLATSIPMAYVGGAVKLPQDIFYAILLISLCFVIVRIYLWRDTGFKLELDKPGRIAISLLAGSILGFVAGTVGIGGGIYLVPLILVLGLGTQKEAAASGAIFIWVNSLFGLASRLQYNAIDLSVYVPLIIAVLLGGALGSYLGSTRLSPRTMEKILGLIIVAAIVALANKLFAA